MPSLSVSGIMIEGMKRALGRTPSSGEQSRALDYWAEEIKNDLWMESESHRVLQATALTLLTEGTQRYSTPSDYAELIGMTVLDGDERETAAGGTTTTITLSSNDSNSEEWHISKEIVLIAGAGSGQRSTITAYNTSTRVATVSPAFTSPPNATTNYVIIDYYDGIDVIGIEQFNEETNQTTRYRPTKVTEYGDQFYFWGVPDKTYPVLIRYWVNLNSLDVNSSTFNTALIDWRSLFTQGFFVKTLQNEDDSRFDSEFVLYRDLLTKIVGKGLRSGHVKPQEMA